MTVTQKALPPTWLNRLLPKPTCSHQDRGRQGWGSGLAHQHESCTAQEPPCHFWNMCPFLWGQCQAGAQGANSTVAVSASAEQKGPNPHPNPWGPWPPQTSLRDLPAVPLLSVSCSLALRPTICHDVPLSSHPQPAWGRPPGQCHGVVLPGTCLLTKDRVRLACKGRGSHLHVRGERTVVSLRIIQCTLCKPFRAGFYYDAICSHYTLWILSLFDMGLLQCCKMEKYNSGCWKFKMNAPNQKLLYHPQHLPVLYLLVSAPGVAVRTSLRLPAGTSNPKQKRWHHYHLYSQIGLVIGSQGAGMTSFPPALLCHTGASGESLSSGEGMVSVPIPACQVSMSVTQLLSFEEYVSQRLLSVNDVHSVYPKRHYHHVGKFLFD